MVRSSERHSGIATVHQARNLTSRLLRYIGILQRWSREQPNLQGVYQNSNCFILYFIRVNECKIMNSKKRPLWIVWKNPDPMNEFLYDDFKIIFKNGDGMLVI